MYLPINNICHSRINGPGNRLVIWVQGCKFHCKGCFNQETHPYTTEHLMEIDELAEIINRDKEIDGITISGGEPLDYPRQLEALLHKLKNSLTSIIYSGFTIDEIVHNELLKKVIKQVDLAIVGRYDESLPHPYLGKRFIKPTNRIDLNYFQPKQVVEYVTSGTFVTKTGIFNNYNKKEFQNGTN